MQKINTEAKKANTPDRTGSGPSLSENPQA